MKINLIVFFLLLSIFLIFPPLSAQGKITNDYYAGKWNSVDSLYREGQPKSAQLISMEIYKKAKFENNSQQLIKALIYRMKYSQNVDEESIVKINKFLNDELSGSKFPATPLLHSLIADNYWNYYKRNRYEILNRTETVNFKEDDIRTWDLSKIVAKVIYHHSRSLAKIKKLQRTKIDIYDKIISGDKKTRKFRPTLYDFLVHKVIDFYANSESGLVKPRYEFNISDDKYFSVASEFSKLKLKSKDTLSFKFYALRYLQQAVKFHLKDSDQAALIDVDLKRLKFVYANFVSEKDKEKLYERALFKLLDDYQEQPSSCDISYQLAVLYQRKGDGYKPLESEKYKWFKKNGYDICHTAIDKFPDYAGVNNCKYLLNQIGKEDVSLKTEAINPIAKPFRALVNYKNTKKLYFKVLKYDKIEKDEFSSNKLKWVKKVLAENSPVQEWELDLPDDGDFQYHSLEMAVPALSSGEYILIASLDGNFKTNNLQGNYTFFKISNIAYLDRKNKDGSHELRLFDRISGKPLKGVVVQLWSKSYSRISRKQEFKKEKQLITDEAGVATITEKGNKRQGYYGEFINGDDRLFTDEIFRAGRGYDRAGRSISKTFFFTDRSIYRPGQTIYFKGIMLKRDHAKKTNELLFDKKTKVIFYDVNRKKISDINLISNEFGTFSGSFQIPDNILSGNFIISNNSGSVRIGVEEYKRPKFEVSFKQPKENFKLNSIVKIEGKATALAGFNIVNGKVNYRVTREAFFPYRWCYYGAFPHKVQKEIAHGELKTDKNGEFEIQFKAIPDLKIDKNQLPAFRYTVTADITDINGETRSSSKTVTIGYTALKFEFNMQPEIDKEEKNQTITINSTNLSGEFIPAKGEVSIYRLKDYEKLLRKRLWSQPDRHLFSQGEYKQKFPHDIYAAEDQIKKLAREKRIFFRRFDTKKSKKIKLAKLSSWQTGIYLAEILSKDRFGNKVKEIAYFTVYSSTSKEVPYKTVNYFFTKKGDYQPGETAEIIIASYADDLTVLYEIEHNGEIVQSEYLALNREQKIIKIPVLEKYRGNFFAHFTFIKNNRIYDHTQTIIVPWDNKKLDIRVETFRDKLKPGEGEKWKIKIKGKEGDKVAAEMVATLYDASLDALRPHRWDFNILYTDFSEKRWGYHNFGCTTSRSFYNRGKKRLTLYRKKYESLNLFGYYPGYNFRGDFKGGRSGGGRILSKSSAKGMPSPEVAMSLQAIEVGADANDSASDKEEIDIEDDNATVSLRRNFQETAFFYPKLRTDKNGEIIVSFTMPEAVTRWNLMALAHSKDLKSGMLFKELVTQKELMVVPNAPRFVRERDELIFGAKIVNLSEEKLKGRSTLQLFDALTMKSIDAELKNKNKIRSFAVREGESSFISFKLKIPEEIGAITYRITAEAENFSDGEENTIPVLKNRMLVTESLPLAVGAKETKEFVLEKLLHSGKSKTLKNHKLTLEYSSNPAWYAVQALPFLAENSSECSDQLFTRFYANSIAANIVNSNPKIKRVFDSWKNTPNSNTFLSNLEKNKELKTLLIDQTPWLLEAKNEGERKRRIGLLFDVNRMKDNLHSAISRLEEMQTPSGAWPWFKGMRENRYITQYIISGFAHLKAMGSKEIVNNTQIKKMISEALLYLDEQLKKDYDRLVENKSKLENNNLGQSQIQYLYARSYFQDYPIKSDAGIAFDYYLNQSKKHWLSDSKYMQGMIALSLQKYGEKKIAGKIIKSLKEYSITTNEMGMYWKTNGFGYYWHQAPIERQALLIEAFEEITPNDKKSIEAMKTWLLKQKQTQDWRTPRATAAACYALLRRGSDLLNQNKTARITLGDREIKPHKIDGTEVEAGTGYFKTSWSGAEIQKEMAKVKVENSNDLTSWGALYWQYFENIDKITAQKTPLQLTKKLFVEKPSGRGPVIKPVNKYTRLETGDKIKVRIILKVDRNMEYIHMRDLRAAGFEPENTNSGYKWQDGLGYYQTTKDASTDFFFDYIAKGTYVFEYPLRVTHAGEFSAGITTIQCIYAPEFTSHSKGLRVKVK